MTNSITASCIRNFNGMDGPAESGHERLARLRAALSGLLPNAAARTELMAVVEKAAGLEHVSTGPV